MALACNMKKVLLHVCCGVCAGAPIKRLKDEGFEVEALFFNPNIHPFSEYVRRLETCRRVTGALGVVLVEGRYLWQEWMDECRQYAKEPEGGKRCQVCFYIRLKEALRICEERNCDYFTTTLTISPHKKSRDVFSIGHGLGEKSFLEIDFKKKEGFKKTLLKAKEMSLYRQNYCGCVYSKKAVSRKF
jgi:predicted adenine nucleotide alpha hydrolase (AANH) superfamily ATPase